MIKFQLIVYLLLIPFNLSMHRSITKRVVRDPKARSIRKYYTPLWVSSHTKRLRNAQHFQITTVHVVCMSCWRQICRSAATLETRTRPPSLAAAVVRIRTRLCCRKKRKIWKGRTYWFQVQQIGQTAKQPRLPRVTVLSLLSNTSHLYFYLLNTQAYFTLPSNLDRYHRKLYENPLRNRLVAPQNSLRRYRATVMRT